MSEKEKQRRPRQKKEGNDNRQKQKRSRDYSKLLDDMKETLEQATEQKMKGRKGGQ